MPGTRLSDLHAVYSHPQGLAQCSAFTKEHHLEASVCSSTSAAAKAVAGRKEPGIAAICSEQAAEEYGLEILQRDIQNTANNCTRFIVISRTLFIPEDAQKISLCFSVPHTTGTLYGVLARFATAGLNLTKIESRPIAGRNFEYDFYLDFSGNIRQSNTLDLLCALRDELQRFSFLGNYIEKD